MRDPYTAICTIRIPRRGPRLRLLTIWHREPTTHGPDCWPHGAWRFHVHHWRLQIHPLQQLRRRRITR